jgi:DNA-binding CsgD family transcriptional regulator
VSAMASGLLPRVVDAVERVTARAADADELLEGVSTEIGKVVPYDAAMWFGLDPTTLLAVSPARMEHLDGGYCNTFWFGEFHEQDANLFADLARGATSAATLRSATDDRPMRSARYRDFLQPQGFDDELRVVFRTAGKPWGVGVLLREPGRAAFDASDVAVLDAVSPIVGAAFRTHAALTAPAPGFTHAPGLMLFNRDGAIISANDAASRWLAEIYGEDPGTNWFEILGGLECPDVNAAIPIIPLIARAHAVASGRDAREARLRLRDRSGRWLLLHASLLDSPSGDGNVAIVVEPAKSGDLAPIIIEAYGLTRRERDVVRAIARGSSTPDIATELFLSAHTVRDHIKAVFDKVGVSSRGELVAKLFADHYADPFHETLAEVH